MSEFLYMGGYAFYVWSAYAVTVAVLVANVVLPVAALRRLRRSLAGGRGRS